MAKKKNVVLKESSSFLEKLPEFPLDYADMDRYFKEEPTHEADLIFKCPLCGTVLPGIHEDYCSNFKIRGDCDLFDI